MSDQHRNALLLSTRTKITRKDDDAVEGEITLVFHEQQEEKGLCFTSEIPSGERRVTLTVWPQQGTRANDGRTFSRVETAMLGRLSARGDRRAMQTDVQNAYVSSLVAMIVSAALSAKDPEVNVPWEDITALEITALRRLLVVKGGD